MLNRKIRNVITTLILLLIVSSPLMAFQNLAEMKRLNRDIKISKDVLSSLFNENK